MKVQLEPWGDSQGIRIPEELLSVAGSLPDDALQMEASHGQIVIRKQFTHKTLAERDAEFGGRLNLSEEVEWDDPVGTEVW